MGLSKHWHTISTLSEDNFHFVPLFFFIALFFPINCFAARHALLIVTRSLAPWQPLPPSSSKALKMMWNFDISPNCRLFIWIVKNSCVTGPMRRPRHLAVFFFFWLRYVKHNLFQSQSSHNTVLSTTTLVKIRMRLSSRYSKFYRHVINFMARLYMYVYIRFYPAIIWRKRWGYSTHCFITLVYHDSNFRQNQISNLHMILGCGKRMEVVEGKIKTCVCVCWCQFDIL